MGRKWEKSVVYACGHDCCEEQSNAGTFCWIWASVSQQQLSCPSQGWECAVVAVQALGLGTEEAPVGNRRSWWVREARMKSSSCSGIPQLLSCSARFPLRDSPEGPELLRSALGVQGCWGLGKPHTASCGVLLWLQEDFTGRSRAVVLNPCYLSQGQECKPPMKCKVLVVCYLDT